MEPVFIRDIVKLKPSDHGFFLCGFDEHANAVISFIKLECRSPDYLIALLQESDIEVIGYGHNKMDDIEKEIKGYLEINNKEYTIIRKGKSSIIVYKKINPDRAKEYLDSWMESFYGINCYDVEEKTIYHYEETMPVVNLLKDCGAVKSTSESRRLIEQNSVTIGCMLSEKDTFVLSDNVYRLYKIGKKRFLKVRVSQSKGDLRSLTK
jgi:hypothetical protein